MVGGVTTENRGLTPFAENYDPGYIMNGRKIEDEANRSLDRTKSWWRESLLDIFEIEEGDPEDSNTCITGKIKTKINEAKIIPMVKSFIENHPESKDRLLKLIEDEVGLKIIL